MHVAAVIDQKDALTTSLCLRWSVRFVVVELPILGELGRRHSLSHGCHDLLCRSRLK